MTPSGFWAIAVVGWRFHLPAVIGEHETLT
jgi:hypothetical protein